MVSSPGHLGFCWHEGDEKGRTPPPSSAHQSSDADSSRDATSDSERASKSSNGEWSNLSFQFDGTPIKSNQIKCKKSAKCKAQMQLWNRERKRETVREVERGGLVDDGSPPVVAATMPGWWVQKAVMPWQRLNC
ncbi:hypothetical protein NL676_002840 [Syzygium grande]|nr:hypothetical protein NL676_002840 [Syzygium grande]